MSFLKIIFIVGPTAVGKSDVAFYLAQKMRGEIISCDSMQIYKEIDIASNKPAKDMLRDVSHHLINIISIEEGFDVARFNQLARGAIKAIHARGNIPIVVGGTGMYMQVLLDGLFEGGEKNDALRQELRQLAKMEGCQGLYDRLKKEDAIAARKIHPHDVKKVVRALEVCRMEKAPMSELQKKRQGLWGEYPMKLFALNLERPLLYQKINERVDQMFEQGLVEEIQKLQEAEWSRTARGLIGVKEILDFLDGVYDLERARYLIKRNTRHLAKRQLTWFRREQRLTWVMRKSQETVKDIAENIYANT